MPSKPRTPRNPRRPTSTSRTAVSAGTSAAGGGVIAALLYGFGISGEIAAPVGVFGSGLLGATAKWARDVQADRAAKGAGPSLLHSLIAALGVVFLAIGLGGCAVAAKIGPGPYGWATLEYDIARTANLEATLSPPMICVGCYDEGSRFTDDPNADPMLLEE